jgi:hypothetical protein
MRSGGTCGGCAFWEVSDGDPNSGRCRARPPTALTPQGHAAWPMTASSDWCGEYKSPAAEAQKS